jgi:beta-galactosidase
VDEPNLYTLFSEVLIKGSDSGSIQVVDTERTTFGIRSIAVDAKSGFRLNGKPMKLRGGCVHHDNGPLGAASYDRAEERKVELLKGSGFNAIRCAHNPPAPALLDACDRLGMLVIDESFDCWRTGKVANDYHLFFEKYWQEDTESMVKRDRNHPSVILWSIGNEIPERVGISDGYAWARKQADFIRQLDPTRWITSAVPAPWEHLLEDPDFDFVDLLDAERTISPQMIPTDPAEDHGGNATRPFCEALDVVGSNYSYYRYEFERKHFPERVIVGTETSPYRSYDTWKETERQPHVIGDFVWTAWDYMGESGIGKVDFDTLVPFFLVNQWPFHLANCGDIDICGAKRPQSYYRDLMWGVRSTPYIGVLDPELHGKKLKFTSWGWEPVLDSWTFPGAEGKPTKVYVYAVEEEVELVVNGISLGRKPAGEAQKYKAVFEVTYEPGTIEAVGYRDGKGTNRARLSTAGAPAALCASVDRSQIRSEYGDLAYVTVEIVDQNGCVVKWAENEVTLNVSGAGELIAVGTANPVSKELYVGSRRRAWKGSLMAIIRSTGQAGEIVLTASAEGFAPAEIRLLAK